MPKTISKTVYTFEELIEAAKDPESPVNSHAVDKARAWLQEGQTDHEWWDYQYEEWKDILDQIGFENPDINFSGFWSSGDGASFTATLDCEKLIAFFGKIKAKKSIDSDKDSNYKWVPYIVHRLTTEGYGKLTEPKYKILPKVFGSLYGKVERSDSHHSHWNTCRTDITAEDCIADDEAAKVLADICYGDLDELVREFEAAVEELRADLSKMIYRDLEKEHEYLCEDEQLIETSDANDYTFDENGDFER